MLHLVPPSVGDDGGVEIPSPDPPLAAMLDAVNNLFDAHPGEHAQVGAGFYLDGDQQPRTRHKMLRVVS